jgi:hypothetical protein
MRVRREFSALLDLVLEEIGCFDHAITTTKPRSPGLRQTKNATTRYLFREIRGREATDPNSLRLRLTGDCTAGTVQSPVGLANRRVYLRLTM